MRKYEIIFIYKLEQKFGKNFSISMKQLCEFIDEEIENGISEQDILIAMYKLYRDYVIDLESLNNVVDYFGYIPNGKLKVLGDKARQVLHNLSEYVESEDELHKRLYHEYQCKKISFNLYSICVLLMGHTFDKQFIDMNEEERLQSLWTYDEEGNLVSIDKKYRKFIDVYNGILNLDNTGLLIPSEPYLNNFDFIRDYMKQKNIPNRVLKDAGLYRKYKGHLSQFGFKKKLDIFKMIITLDLPTSIAKQFLAICGYAFDPFDEIDMYIFDYINGKMPKVKTFQEFADMYDEKFNYLKTKDKYFECTNWE